MVTKAKSTWATPCWVQTTWIGGDACYEGEFLENGVPHLPASSEVIEEGTGERESSQETDPEVADAGEGEILEHLTHDKIRKSSFLKRFQNWLS